MEFFYALRMFCELGLPLVLGVAAGGFIAGLIQAFARVEERSISFAGKLCGFGLAYYLTAPRIAASFVEFSARMWGAQ
ncbi:MAG: flagellar biosynthetic protein FliQ [Deltaproteobacteria bacterium]|nr:flagellar biosynthetic protein FliQ [Deltaproteobacteria bacterium]